MSACKELLAYGKAHLHPRKTVHAVGDETVSRCSTIYRVMSFDVARSVERNGVREKKKRKKEPAAISSV